MGRRRASDCCLMRAFVEWGDLTDPSEFPVAVPAGEVIGGGGVSQSEGQADRGVRTSPPLRGKHTWPTLANLALTRPLCWVLGAAPCEAQCPWQTRAQEGKVTHPRLRAQVPWIPKRAFPEPPLRARSMRGAPTSRHSGDRIRGHCSPQLTGRRSWAHAGHHAGHSTAFSSSNLPISVPLSGGHTGPEQAQPDPGTQHVLTNGCHHGKWLSLKTASVGVGKRTPSLSRRGKTEASLSRDG